MLGQGREGNELVGGYCELASRVFFDHYAPELLAPQGNEFLAAPAEDCFAEVGGEAGEVDGGGGTG